MPRNQVASVANYGIGAKVAGTSDDNAEVLRFQFKEGRGGPLTVTVETDEVDLTVSAQLSDDDGASFTDSAALADEVVVAGASKTFVIGDIEQNNHTHIRFVATGGGQGVIQIRPDAGLEIVDIHGVV